MRKLTIALILLAIAGTAFAQTAPVLKIDFQYNVTAADAGNFFFFTGSSPVKSARSREGI